MKTAQQLIDEGYWVTSRRHRHVGKLPEGKTAMETLRERAPTAHQHILERMEREALSTVLRVYNEGLVETLDQETFDEFKRLGGESC